MLTELIDTGGPVIYFLIACSVGALAIIFERLIFWVREWTINPLSKCSMCDDVDNDTDNECSIPLATGADCFTSRVADAEASRRSQNFYERATKNLSGLDTVISISPLLGILGTVLGIMKSFHSLDLKHMGAPQEISHGLAEAMLTTAAGLCIAVPALVFYNLFQSMARRRARKIYHCSKV